MSDSEKETDPTREDVKIVIETAAKRLAGRVAATKAGKWSALLSDLPYLAAYYSILATDDQEAIMQEQRQLAQDQQVLTKAMHCHSKVMLFLSSMMLLMTAGIVVLTILLLARAP